MKFCSQCGHLLEGNPKFCPNCGHEVERTVSPIDSERSVTQDTEQMNHTQTCNDTAGATNSDPAHQQTVPNGTEATATATPMTPEQKRRINLGLIALVVLLGCYLLGKGYYSEARQIERIITAFETKDPDKMAKVVNSQDKEFKATKDTLQPLAKYYQDHPDTLTGELSNLRDMQAARFSPVVKKGKILGLYDRYVWEISPVYLNVMSTVPNTSVTINDKDTFELKEKSQTHRVGPYAPGIQSITAKTTIDGHEADYSREVQAFAKDEQVNLDFKMVTYQITTNVESAKIYVNGEHVGDVQGYRGQIGPTLAQEGTKIHLEYELDNGDQVTTREYETTGHEQDIPLPFDILTQDGVKHFVDNYLYEFRNIHYNNSNQQDKELRFYDLFTQDGKETARKLLEEAKGVASKKIDWMEWKASDVQVKQTASDTFALAFNVNEQIKYLQKEDGERNENYRLEMVIKMTPNPNNSSVVATPRIQSLEKK